MISALEDTESPCEDLIGCKDDKRSSDFKTSTASDATAFDHFSVRRCCEWRGSRIRQLSAGFNHSAFVTERGELYTWGRALEMQLGHDDKKDRNLPTRVHLPDRRPVKWEHVECARNFTMAVNSSGNVYVWGRNDRNQLGLSNCKAPADTKVRRIALKPKAGGANATKYIELPSNTMNVGKPTRLIGIEVSADRVSSAAEIVQETYDKIKSADQNSLNSSSRFFAKNPASGRLLENLRRSFAINQNSTKKSNSFSFAVVFTIANLHVSSGELLRTIDALILPTRLLNEYRIYDLVDIAHDTGVRNDNNGLQTTSVTTSSKLLFKSTSKRRVDSYKPECHTTKNTQSSLLEKDENTILSNTNENTNLISKTEQEVKKNYKDSKIEINSSTFTSFSIEIIKDFDEIIDRIWNLIRAHPQRDIQIVALLTMLRERFPIYHRLAADTRLCRLIDLYVSEFLPEVQIAINHFGSTPIRPTFSSSSSRHKPWKFSDLAICERHEFLINPKLVAYLKSSTQHARLNALRQRCEAERQMNRFRFYVNCGHYERCVIESGPSKQKISALRNRLCKCGQCVVRGRYASILPPVNTRNK